MQQDFPAWNYFNGGQHGWNDAAGYHPPAPITAAYCAACAPEHLPGWNAEARRGTEHHESEFSCAPWRIGLPCAACGKAI